MGEFKQIQEILSKIGTEIFKIDEEMTEKNETEDGNSISLKSPWHMKWDRQQFLPFFPVAEIGSIMHLLYFSYPHVTTSSHTKYSVASRSTLQLLSEPSRHSQKQFNLTRELQWHLNWS